MSSGAVAPNGWDYSVRKKGMISRPNPVPCFWLVYGRAHSSFWIDIFKEMGFRILKQGPMIKVTHCNEKVMLLLQIKYAEEIEENGIIIRKFVHNTKETTHV